MKVALRKREERERVCVFRCGYCVVVFYTCRFGFGEQSPDLSLFFEQWGVQVYMDDGSLDGAGTRSITLAIRRARELCVPTVLYPANMQRSHLVSSFWARQRSQNSPSASPSRWRKRLAPMEWTSLLPAHFNTLSGRRSHNAVMSLLWSSVTRGRA